MLMQKKIELNTNTQELCKCAKLSFVAAAHIWSQIKFSWTLQYTGIDKRLEERYLCKDIFV